MQRVEWHDDLSVGIEEIDNQHKELFKAINAFLDTVDTSKNMRDVAVVISFLEEYVGVHFDTEEDVMRKHDYPHYDEHIAQHRDFAETVSYLGERYLEFGQVTTSTFKVMIQRKLIDWLTEHVVIADKKLAAFLQDRPDRQ